MTTPDSIPMSQWPSDYEYVLPVAPGADVVTVTIDGNPVQVRRGELLIKAAQQHGTYIPRFCWHERMKPVGMCRMCLVEVEGMRGLQISCATPVADGMVVSTQSDVVKTAQDGVLEFLLINHPLDCPVCDRGGECPLQDQTLAFGPGESRFVEEKRHFEKPVAISDLVLLDRERCIQCGRCTRFAAEIAGEPLIDFGGRGGTTEVITYPNKKFSSYFSGNTVQICPVGALTASAYRFRARPWDLETAETSCQSCAVACRGAIDSTSNRIVRLLGVDSEPVNQGWLCDKGRYGYEWVHAPDRVKVPLVRVGTEHREVSWPEALDAAVTGLRRALDGGGPGSIGVLGGARGTNEDAFLWARFAKDVLGTDNVDAQLADGLPAEVVLGLPRAVIPDLDRARGIVLLGPDLQEELPVLHLRVRRAAVELGVPVVEIAPRATSLTREASAVLRHAPGESAAIASAFARALAGDGTASGDGQIERAVAALDGREGDLVVVLGRQSLAESPDAVVAAAAALAVLPDVTFLSSLRRANVHGALDMGLAPGFAPGRVLREGERGLDAAGILAATAAGRIDTLVLLGTDLLSDFPDRQLVRQALDAVRFVVAVGAFVSDASARADVFFPTSVWGEKNGSTTNLEGRVMRVARLVTPEGTAMVDWRVAAELANRFGTDFGLDTVEDVQDEIARVAPAYAGVDASLLSRARDGAVVPIASHPDALTFRAAPGVVAGVSWEPIPPGAVVQADADADEVVVEEAPAVPEPDLYRWDRAVTAPVPGPADAYSLRLVAARTLYDAGRTVSSSPSLAPLATGPAIVVHPSDLQRVGVGAEGDTVRVTSARGSVEVPVRVDNAVAPGTCFMPFAQDGDVGPNDLVDVTAAVTELRVETVR